MPPTTSALAPRREARKPWVRPTLQPQEIEKRRSGVLNDRKKLAITRRRSVQRQKIQNDERVERNQEDKLKNARQANCTTSRNSRTADGAPYNSVEPFRIQ